ncbi:RH39 [Auxenochlorella protothecoides x Auxenochlorella symbiontica]
MSARLSGLRLRLPTQLFSRSLLQRRPFTHTQRCPLKAHSVSSQEELRSTPAGSTEGEGVRFAELSPALHDALNAWGFTTPTDVQSSAIPALLESRGSDFLLASHTGSGKTLAYLLPLVQSLKEGEARGTATKPHRPRALVLGPTRELTDQILKVAKSLSHHAKFRSAGLSGGAGYRQQKVQLAQPLDVVVGTPQRILQHAEEGNLYYGDVETVVLDEADTMLDRGFGPEVRRVLAAVRGKPRPARCVLVSATVTRGVRALMEAEFPGMLTVQGEGLHRGVAGARHVFQALEPGTDKMAALAALVAGEAARGRRVMVFANTLASCRAAEHALAAAGLDTACYHGDMPAAARGESLRRFGGARTGAGASPGAGAGGDARGEGGAGAGEREEDGAPAPPVLVCTDLAARGLDIPGRVDHVINFDFPLNPVDYLHRTGRTARAGSTGRITSLIAKGDRVLAARIEEALQRGLPLDGLSADRRVLPDHARPKPETLARRAKERLVAKHERRGRRGGARDEVRGGWKVRGGEPRAGEPRAGEPRAGPRAGSSEEGAGPKRYGGEGSGASGKWKAPTGRKPFAAARSPSQQPKRGSGARARPGKTTGGGSRHASTKR